MKLLVVLLALTPFVLGKPMDNIDKRGLLDFLGVSHLLDLDQLKTIIGGILQEVGSDASEQSCETACHNILALDETHLLHTVCNPICRSFQTLVHLIPIHQRSALMVDKRGILDFLGLGHLLDLGQLKTIIGGILQEVGSDASEQNCETACHNILALDETHLLHTVCNPICRSFQTLVHLIPIHQGSAAVVDKRGITDFLGLGHLLDLDQLKTILANITREVGSDASEQNCENACHNILAMDLTHLLHTVCTPICRSFQTLIHLIPIHRRSAPMVDKRGLFEFLGLGHLLNLDQLKTLISGIVEEVGSDASEQNCETACQNILALDVMHLLSRVCTPICRSFQTLVHLIPTHHDSAPVVDKRGILDFLGLGHLLNLDQLKTILANITRDVGSDASEQTCETACHNIIALEETHVLHTICIPICRSFQTLIHLIPIHRRSAPMVDKRGLLDFLGVGHLLNIDQLKTILANITREVGSDASEQNCENACHNILAMDLTHLLHTVCTPICRSFQTLIHLIPIHRRELS